MIAPNEIRGALRTALGSNWRRAPEVAAKLFGRTRRLHYIINIERLQIIALDKSSRDSSLTFSIDLIMHNFMNTPSEKARFVKNRNILPHLSIAA